MSVIVPVVGDIAILAEYLATQSFRLRLYQNNYTPVAASVLADFTVATFDGYAQQVVPAGSWTVPVNDGANRAISYNALLTFVKAAGATGNNIYGYYIVDAGGTKLYWAERFTGAPVAMSTVGATLNVLPVLTLKSEF